MTLDPLHLITGLHRAEVRKVLNSPLHVRVRVHEGLDSEFEVALSNVF